jgi:hypothetical protein
MKTIKTYRKALLCAVVVGFASLSAFAQNEMVMKVWSGIPDNTPDPVGEQAQKEAVERFYTLLFSHPAVEAISWWDLSDKDSWNNAPSGLLRINMTPKPAYTALKKLIKEDWATNETLHTDASGIATLRAFRGKYRLTVSLPSGGKVYAFSDLVEKGDNEIVLRLDDLVMKIWQGAAVVNEYPVASVDSVTFAPPKTEVLDHQIISGLNVTDGLSGCTVKNHGDYTELIATGNDPNIYTITLPENIGRTAYTKVTFNMEYQADRWIGNAQLFYGRPDAAGGVSSPENLVFENTGLDAANESKWATFTFDCTDAIATYSWGDIGHRLRWDFVNWNIGTTVYAGKMWFDIYTMQEVNL